MDNSGYLFAAFAIIWIVFFGYVLILARRQSRLEMAMKALTKILRDKTV